MPIQHSTTVTDNVDTPNAAKWNAGHISTTPFDLTTIPGSYVIYLDGSTYYARNGKTGVNDYSGVDPATVTNSAISALGSGGGMTFMRSLVYSISTPILIPNNVNLQGEGWGTTLKAQNFLNNDVIKVTGSYVEILYLQVDGNKANNTSGNGINFQPAIAQNEGLVLGVKVVSCKGDGIRVGAISPGFNLIRVIGCSVTANGGIGININAFCFASAISCTESTNNGSHGIFLASTSDFRVSNNTVFGNTGDGINIASSSDGAVVNNNSSNNVSSGIRVNGGCKIVTVTDNLCDGNSFGQVGVSPGIVVSDSLDRITVSRNICTDSQVTKTQSYGIYISGTTDNCDIYENVLLGNQTAGLIMTGSPVNMRIKDNRGYNPLGVAAITPGASPYTHTNNDNVSEAVYLDGARGAAGTLTVAKNAITVYSLGNNEKFHLQVWLEPAEAIVVTYTSGAGDTLTMNKDRK